MAMLRSVPVRLDVRRAQLAATFVAILVPLVALGFLAEDVWAGQPFAWDAPLMEAARAFASPAGDGAMVAASIVGAPRAMFVVSAAVAGVLYRKGYRQRAAFMAISAGGAGLLNAAAKAMFRRERPDLWVPLVAEHDFGFPSGHAMGTMAVVLAIAVLAWGTRWRVLVAVVGAAFVALVGASRVYLGVHFPSDVMAGWLASAAWVMAVRAGVPFLGDAGRRRLAAYRAGRL